MSERLADRFVRDLCRRLREPVLENRDHVLSRLHDVELELEAFANELLLAHMIDEGDEGLPVIVDIAKDDRLRMSVELRPCRDLDQYLDSAKPDGHCTATAKEYERGH